MYGAKCDGITDDTEAFERAIRTGKNVILKGTYLISDIYLCKGQRLIGKDKSRLLYNSISLLDNCVIKNVVLDGQWKTKGVSVLGSNVLIENCCFLNTKNTRHFYGGLTSALWIGQYGDLNDDKIKYQNIQIKNCIFDGCEPNDTVTKAYENKTVARFILSYGCDNLIIKGCEFRNLKGFHDSDCIQLRSYEKESCDFPYYDENPNWKGSTPPFYKRCYSNSKTLIKKCVFYQSDCKSSIKVMAGDVRIDNNIFIIDNKSPKDVSYSVIRLHRANLITIRHNKINQLSGKVKSIIIVENSLDVNVSNNIINCEASSYIDSFWEIRYSKDCTFINNSSFSYYGVSLLETEFNRSVSIKKNTFTIGHLENDIYNLFVQQPNHYSYPSLINGITVFDNNTIILPLSKNSSFDYINRYDYDIEYKANKTTTIK